MDFVDIWLYVGIIVVALCIFFARGNAREQEKRINSDKNALSEKLGYIEYSTLDVVLLTICTSGFYYFYMAYIQGQRLLSSSAEAKLLPGCALAAAGVLFLGTDLSSMLDATIVESISRITEDNYFMIVGASNLILIIGNSLLFILMMYFSFKSRQIIQKILEENEILVPMNGFLCFLFPAFYQHYVIHNAAARFAKATAKPEINPAPQTASPQQPQEDKLAKLEKLGQLREAGLLSEEEFQEEKKKLLSCGSGFVPHEDLP